MIDSGFYNMNCMEAMKEFPDKFFDLAIVDPPYGIKVASHKGGKIIGGGRGSSEVSPVYAPAKSNRTHQNFIIPSPMTVRRTKDISPNSKESRKIESSGAGTSCSTISARRLA